MSPTRAPRRIGMLGGTFDPVHNGHLRTALEVADLLGLSELRLVPVNAPALRARPVADAAQRLEMLRLAVGDTPPLRVDDRELRRGGVSYSIDTLRETRAEIGERDRLCMVIGEDAFSALDRWKDWQRLLDYAHLAVLTRPGDTPPPRPGVAGWAAEHLASDPERALREHSRGCLLRLAASQLEISSTRIRRLLAESRSPRYLLPDAVIDYIGRHRIYGAAGSGAGETP